MITSDQGEVLSPKEQVPDNTLEIGIDTIEEQKKEINKSPPHITKSVSPQLEEAAPKDNSNENKQEVKKEIKVDKVDDKEGKEKSDEGQKKKALDTAEKKIEIESVGSASDSKLGQKKKTGGILKDPAATASQRGSVSHLSVDFADKEVQEIFTKNSGDRKVEKPTVVSPIIEVTEQVTEEPSAAHDAEKEIPADKSIKFKDLDVPEVTEQKQVA